jgi:hypothetical protein
MACSVNTFTDIGIAEGFIALRAVILPRAPVFCGKDRRGDGRSRDSAYQRRNSLTYIQ